VAYAFVQDVASSWHRYERVAAALVDPPPKGLILHVAGPTDEGFRIIGVWESQESWQRFQAEKIAPAIAALGGPAYPEPTFRDLHPVHLVVGRTHATPERLSSPTPPSLGQPSTPRRASDAAVLRQARTNRKEER